MIFLLKMFLSGSLSLFMLVSCGNEVVVHKHPGISPEKKAEMDKKLKEAQEETRKAQIELEEETKKLATATAAEKIKIQDAIRKLKEFIASQPQI